MPFVQFRRFENYEWLDKSQLKLVIEYICGMMNDYNSLYEYYYGMYSFAMKCYSVLKKRNNVRIGLTLCKGEIVDFLLDDKHKDCTCSSVFFKTKLN